MRTVHTMTRHADTQYTKPNYETKTPTLKWDSFNGGGGGGDDGGGSGGSGGSGVFRFSCNVAHKGEGKKHVFYHRFLLLL